MDYVINVNVMRVIIKWVFQVMCIYQSRKEQKNELTAPSSGPF